MLCNYVDTRHNINTHALVGIHLNTALILFIGTFHNYNKFALSHIDCIDTTLLHRRIQHILKNFIMVKSHYTLSCFGAYTTTLKLTLNNSHKENKSK